ncbi:hypothetical protein GOODEAATRI_022231 [Goodea atripinnis]|uniref:Uncharacterized protein n=1 Tax=Goodea atripinnis TaxID=208336 RepID=A0ABV0P6X8_9TELE
MLKRRVNHDSPTTSRDLRYSVRISSAPEALPPLSIYGRLQSYCRVKAMNTKLRVLSPPSLHGGTLYSHSASSSKFPKIPYLQLLLIENYNIGVYVKILTNLIYHFHLCTCSGTHNIGLLAVVTGIQEQDHICRTSKPT